MESKYHWTSLENTTQSFNSNYFSHHSGGYMGNRVGQAPHGNFEHHQVPYSFSFSLPHPPPGPTPQPPRDMYLAIQREIEKERIRDEIIMSEIARRRILEAEVRRELIMERELALQRGSDGLLYDSSLMGYKSPIGGVGSIGGERFLEERVTSPPKEREWLNVGERGRFDTSSQRRTFDQRISEIKPVPLEREKLVRSGGGGFDPLLCQRGTSNMRISDIKPVTLDTERSVISGSGEFDTLPFQRMTSDLRISEIKPVPMRVQEEEKINLLVKPDPSTCGLKRKAITLPGMGASELQPNGISNKKPKEEWSCVACQISATSEQALNEHLGGKKHKAKEAELRTQRTGKNYSIGLLPVKVNHIERATKTAPQSLQFKNTGGGNSNIDKPAVLHGTPNSGNTKQKFWCDLCKVGAPSETVMNDHKRGKKHMKLLQKSNHKGRKQ